MQRWFGAIIIEHTFTVEPYTGGMVHCVRGYKLLHERIKTFCDLKIPNLCCRFDEDVKHVELDYPRDMSIWRGIGYHIDAAFQWKNGK